LFFPIVWFTWHYIIIPISDKKTSGGARHGRREKTRNRKEFKKNYETAKKMAEDGEHIKMLPVHQGKGVTGWKNPDYLINASLWELESPNGSPSSINHAIRDGQKQSLNLVIQLPQSINRDEVLWTVYRRFTHKDYPANVKNLIIYYGDYKEQWTAEQIRGLKIKNPRTL
jgi:hypothetical protein